MSKPYPKKFREDVVAATPHVYLQFDDNIGAELTPQEALRLARHLRSAAHLARLPR